MGWETQNLSAGFVVVFWQKMPVFKATCWAVCRRTPLMPSQSKRSRALLQQLTLLGFGKARAGLGLLEVVISSNQLWRVIISYMPLWSKPWEIGYWSFYIYMSSVTQVPFQTQFQKCCTFQLSFLQKLLAFLFFWYFIRACNLTFLLTKLFFSFFHCLPFERAFRTLGEKCQLFGSIYSIFHSIKHPASIKCRGFPHNSYGDLMLTIITMQMVFPA